MKRPYCMAGLTGVLIAGMAFAQAPGDMPAMPAQPSAAAPAMPPVQAPMAPAAVPPAPAPVAEPVMPTPAPTALPEVDVPAITSAPAAAVPTTDQAPVGEAALPTLDQAPQPDATQGEEEGVTTAASTGTIDPAGADYSFGVVNFSLLYTPTQKSRMKSVLAIFENARRNRTDTPIEIVEDLGADPIEQIAPAVVEEPKEYPMFTLKSIAFRNNRDWTVWIGNLRITPAHNDQEVKVIGVTPNLAQFVWTPAYKEALKQRAANKQFASTDPVKHKLTQPNTAAYDSAEGTASFTLRPNQTFSPAYMATFEGKIAPPELNKLGEQPDNLPMDEPSPAGVAPDAAAPAGAPATPTTPGAPAPATAAPATAAPAPATNTSANNPANLDALLRAQQQMVQPAPAAASVAAPAPSPAAVMIPAMPVPPSN